MLWTFQKIRLKGFRDDFPAEWVLKITTISQLMAWHDASIAPMAGNRLHAFMKRCVKPDHSSESIDNLIAMRRQIRGTSFVDELCEVFGRVQSTQFDLIFKGNILYVRSCGSYFYEKDSGTTVAVLKEVTTEVLKFPADQVKYMQWPGGQHWYAKVGNVDIYVDGKNKWWSKEAAEKAVKKYLAGNRSKTYA